LPIYADRFFGHYGIAGSLVEIPGSPLRFRMEMKRIGAGDLNWTKPLQRRRLRLHISR